MGYQAFRTWMFQQVPALENNLLSPNCKHVIVQNSPHSILFSLITDTQIYNHDSMTEPTYFPPLNSHCRWYQGNPAGRQKLKAENREHKRQI